VRSSRRDGGAQPIGGEELGPGEADRVVYQAQRAHELELNRATATFEHAVISPVLLLNGGATVAFLTLLGATSAEKSSLTLSVTWATLAVGIWAIGLVVGAIAVRSGYRSQQRFTQAVAGRRRQMELLLLPEDSVIKPLLEAAKRERDKSDAARVGPEGLQAQGKAAQESWLRFSTLALLLFVAGVILAALSIFLAT
jgi:hypothetical protein